MQFTGVGILRGTSYDPNYGYCTQIAIFRQQKDKTRSGQEVQEVECHPHEWIGDVVYPHFNGPFLSDLEIMATIYRSIQQLPYLKDTVSEHTSSPDSVFFSDRHLWYGVANAK